MKQRTILNEVSIHGKALHTGKEVHLTFKPAPEGAGIVFRRTDQYGKPEIKPGIQVVDDELVRNTDITVGHTKLQALEHVLSALNGCGIDNCIVELDAAEPPILDGSSRPFVNLLLQGAFVEQEKEREYFELKEAISITDGNRSIIALPYDGFKVTCTSADDRGIHTQHMSLDISDPETYIAEIAPARTFTIYEDIEPLLKMGKIQGGSLDSAIVIKGDQILSKEPLRYKDEFVRHKILDIVGDLSLLGKGLKAHIVAVRPGHKLNLELTKRLFEKMTGPDKPKGMERLDSAQSPHARKMIKPDESQIYIRRILDILPHAYPFVMIDRVIEFVSDTQLRAIKNVTINEPYFTGHFPGNPVMPGVLQIESMAQAAGILMLRQVSGEGKIALFMSADKVKFRRAVVPGDQMLIDVKITKNRGNRIAGASATCSVDGKMVSTAELMFTILDVPQEGM